MFILECSLANSLVSFSPRLTLSAGVYEQLPLWADRGGAGPQPVPPPWSSAGLLCPPFISRPLQSHLHPRGARCPCKCLVYIPFVCGMPGCVSHSLIHGNTAGTHRDAAWLLVAFPWALAPAKQGSLARLLFLLSLWLKARKAQGGVPPGGQHPVLISPRSFLQAPHS